MAFHNTSESSRDIHREAKRGTPQTGLCRPRLVQPAAMTDEPAQTADLQSIVRVLQDIAQQMKVLSAMALAVEQLDAQHQKSSADIAVLKTAIGALSQTDTARAEKSGCSVDRATPAENRLMKAIVDRSRALYPLLEWFIKMIVLSIVEGFPEIEGWMRQETLAQLSTVRQDIAGVSGLAFILFSVGPKDDKVMYRMSTGPVWTFVIRCVFSNMIHSSRDQLFKAPKSELQWLADLGDPVRTYAILSSRLSDFNSLRELRTSCSGYEGGPPLKKRRLSESAETDAASRDEFLQKTLIMRLKRSVCRHLIYCRHEVKTFLYEKLPFLIDMIRWQGGLAKAKQLGFQFVFIDSSEDEAISSGAAREAGHMCAVWDVPQNAVPTSKESIDDADTGDEALLLEIERRFPSLAVRLEWSKRVVHERSDVEKHYDEYSISDLTWPTMDEV